MIRQNSEANASNVETQPSDTQKKCAAAVTTSTTSITITEVTTVIPATSTVTSVSTTTITKTSASITTFAQNVSAAIATTATTIGEKMLSVDEKDVIDDDQSTNAQSSNKCLNFSKNSEKTFSNEQKQTETNTKKILSQTHSNASDNNNLVACTLSSVSSVQNENNSSAGETGVPSISFSATPTINVVCAPVIEEDQNKSVIVRKLSESETIRSSESDGEVTVMESQLQQVESSTELAKESKAEDETLKESASATHLKLDVQKCAEHATSAEDLSPSMDEYQECCPASSDYRYDASTSGEILVPGCVAPAPTPSPLIAPLAEVEIDDETLPPTVPEESPTAESQTTATNVAAETSTGSSGTNQTSKRKKKKRSGSESKGESSDGTTKHGDDRNAVCPWEDE